MHKILATLMVVLCGVSSANAAENVWPDWNRFAERFVQADGRVIDVTFDAKSTSEGQSYGMFFALVANQPDRFATILKWTSDNLADGQLGDKPPGWLWGKRDDGSWGLKDRNAASDADLWMAYSLLEAARLWHEPRYEHIGRKLLKFVAEKDVVRVGKFTLLLPGPYGFNLANNRYRLNPSYLPGFMLSYFANVDRSGPWQAVWESYERLAPKIYASGVAPDDFVIDAKGNVMPDTEREPAGSYDAIRVYLWAGMSGEQSRDLVRLLEPYAKVTRAAGKPPEKVNPVNGKVMKADWSPPGFSGALLPFFAALDDKDSLRKLREQIALEKQANKPTNYYDDALLLFGKGWDDGLYRFDKEGRLVPKWEREKLTREER